MSKLISIIIPCYNEADSIPLLINELEKVTSSTAQYQWEYLFINDGSKDDTLSVLKNSRAYNNRVNYIDLSRNYGKEIAMLAGFDFAKGDCAVIMDADLQHPPQIIPLMIKNGKMGMMTFTQNVFQEAKKVGLEKNLRSCIIVF